MTVRVRETAAGPWGVILAGKVGTVPDAVGAAMVKARQAEEVIAQERVIESAETATAEPAQERTAMTPPTRRRKRAEV